MQILRNLFILIMVLATVQLNSYSKLSHHAPAEAHVLQTLTYGIAGGLVINTVCGIVAPRLDPEIRSEDGFASCTPFGLVGAAIVGRMYVYGSGGWGPAEYSYARQLPKSLRAMLRDALPSGGNDDVLKEATSRQSVNEL